MKELLICTSYFPSLSYCKLLKEHKKVTIDIGEHFIKQTQRNRCVILGANGRLKLIVPTEKRKVYTPVKDVRVSYDDNWQKLHWKSLESAYRSSPYFEYYEDKLRTIVLGKKETFLVDINMNSLEFINGVLNLDTEINLSKEYIEAPFDFLDKRNSNHLTEDPDSVSKNYTQVFSDRIPFQQNLSCIDLICNEGPNSINLLA